MNSTVDTFAREEVIEAYGRAHDRHHRAEMLARKAANWDLAEQEHEAALIALRAKERESYNPLPKGLE
jgi:hypothetical protein